MKFVSPVESKIRTPAFNRIAGYGAAGWALAFALLHVAWAAGCYVGLYAEQAWTAFERPWFFRYNLAAAGMCAVAAPLALALTRAWEREWAIRLLMFFGWSVTAILALRGGAGVVKTVYSGVTGQNILNPMLLWDFWFCGGAVLFGTAVWSFRQTSPKTKL